MRSLLIGVIAAAGGLVLLAAAGALFGHPPLEILTLVVRGSLGSRFAVTGTLLKSVPLLLTGLSVALAFRAGVWNIGAEGQFIVGAIAAFIASPWGVLASLLAAMAAGAIWAAIAALLRIWRNAPEVLSTILLNFVAIHLLGWCVNGPLREAARQYPQTDRVDAVLPRLEGIHLGFILALAASLAVWWLLYRTTTGLRLRATGFNPSAAEWAGVNVRGQILRAMAYSGALSGLAGGIELLGVSFRLFERFAAGYGYAGIAVALLAQLHPIAIVASGFFFGALATGAGELQRSMNVSAAVAIFSQAAIILIVVLFAAVDRRRRIAGGGA